MDKKEQTEAEVLGKAMRFGAMLWMDRETNLGEFRWYPKKRQLELRLVKNAMPLFGEVAEARLNSLAASLQAEVKVKQRKG